MVVNIGNLLKKSLQIKLNNNIQNPEKCEFGINCSNMEDSHLANFNHSFL